MHYCAHSHWFSVLSWMLTVLNRYSWWQTTVDLKWLFLGDESCCACFSHKALALCSLPNAFCVHYKAFISGWTCWHYRIPFSTLISVLIGLSPNLSNSWGGGGSNHRTVVDECIHRDVTVHFPGSVPVDEALKEVEEQNSRLCLHLVSRCWSAFMSSSAGMWCDSA